MSIYDIEYLELGVVTEMFMRYKLYPSDYDIFCMGYVVVRMIHNRQMITITSTSSYLIKRNFVPFLSGILKVKCAFDGCNFVTTFWYWFFLHWF